MSMIRAFLAAGVSALLVSGAATAGDRTPSPPGAIVYIVSPADGATVSSPVTVVFGLKGMGVAPAGTEMEKTGHHHLIIDAPLPPAGQPVPADANHKHFGGGQTETTIELARSTGDEKESQLQRLADFHARHADAAPLALKRLQDAAIRGENVFAVLMDAVRCCSLGQVTEALFEVGGKYRRSM